MALYILDQGFFWQDANELLTMKSSGTATATPGTNELQLYSEGSKYRIRQYNAGWYNITPNMDASGNIYIDGNAEIDGSVIINESGDDVDFRIESDTNENAFFLQGSDGNVGIGRIPTTYSFEVAGDIYQVGSNLNTISESTTNSSFLIERGATNYRANIDFRTDGSVNWSLGAIDSDVSGSDGSQFGIGQSNTNIMVWLTTAENFGIGRVPTQSKLEVEGSIKLKEQASSDTDEAGMGQLWIKNTTPCELWFTDDAGTDTQIV